VPDKADVLYDQKKLNIIRMSALDELSILESLVERVIERIFKRAKQRLFTDLEKSERALFPRVG